MRTVVDIDYHWELGGGKIISRKLINLKGFPNPCRRRWTKFYGLNDFETLSMNF